MAKLGTAGLVFVTVFAGLLGNADCGVFGGWPYLAFQYIKRVGGIEKEEDYPYCSGLGGEKGTCFPCPAPAYNASMCGPAVSYCNETESCGFRLDKSKFIPGLQVTDWAAIDTNETTIAVQLMKIGPLSVALNAVLLQFYHRGVFEPHFCDPKSLDHERLGELDMPVDYHYVYHFASQWKHEHNRRYKTADEEKARFATFQDNLLKIEKLNAEYSGTEFATNQFADMSEEEFRSKILMRPRPPPQHPRERYLRDYGEVNDLPEAYNWVDHGAVTPIKDQGSAGSCWAFSTIENLEGQWFLTKHPLTNLSVEQVVDCDDNTDPKTGNADCGVFGGWPYLAFQYIKRVGGIEKEEDYPYCSGLGGEKGTCFPCPAPAYNTSMCGPAVSYCNETESCGFRLDKSKFIPGLQVTDWAAIDTNETTIAVQLMKIGPLSVALNAVLLQFYHRGVFEPHFCDPKSLDHAVLLTGWGVEKTIFGEKKPYWIVKNSWGKKWGMDGYFYIKRGVGQCGINTQVATAILQKT
uniref:Peptidase C1A papain C-terminal domain-containing protein n=1 Tax=Branchiostoma floridae TaxID=7739 RepID=C3YFH2_BRAFL|eukprot:XP_002604925.1 hypothetical protein BRAFLDRAFT_77225 [Branchiostoma floridae]